MDSPTNSTTEASPDPTLSDPKHIDIGPWIKDMEILCERDRIPGTDTDQLSKAVEYIKDTKVKQNLELALCEYGSVSGTQFKNFMLDFHKYVEYFPDDEYITTLNKNNMAYYFGMSEDAIMTERMLDSPSGPDLYHPGHTVDIEAWINTIEDLCEINGIPDADNKRPLKAVEYIDGSFRIEVKQDLELALNKYGPVSWTQFKNFFHGFHWIARLYHRHSGGICEALPLEEVLAEMYPCYFGIENEHRDPVMASFNTYSS